MAIKRIFCIGENFPGEEFEAVDWDSAQTLLDADIILFKPDLDGTFSEDYNGKRVLDEHSSFRAKQRSDHWHSEIIAAVEAGKLVVVFLDAPKEYYRYTGEKQHSGTGRNRATTRIVTEISSYDAIPNLTKKIEKLGSEMELARGATLIASYWKEFGSTSPYKVHIEGKFTSTLVTSKAGNKIVGACVRKGQGCLVFLPPIQIDTKKFVRYDKAKQESFWTTDALQFGKRLVSALSGMHDALRDSSIRTPPPPWTLDSRFRLTLEGRLEGDISALSAQLSALQASKSALEEEHEAAGRLRSLLFEQGDALESAILIALRALGFNAEPFDDGKSEFDAVFSSPEGRCLGEAEGKDSKAINIDKMSQLERNLQEDFARDEVTEYAKGVLFGNAYRLVPLDTRGDYFTAKCVAAAARAKIALVRTPDLFGPARYMIENPSDTDYAKACREALLSCEGAVVVFPPPPAHGTPTDIGTKG